MHVAKKLMLSTLLLMGLSNLNWANNILLPEDSHESTWVNGPNVESVKPAEFPGGESALADYLVKNIKYPSQAIEQRLSGNLMVAVTINDKGEPTNIEIVQGMWGGFEAVVVDAIMNMPNWKPGMQGDNPITTKKYFSFNFQH